MTSDHGLWVRDWALIGAATSGVAPLMASFLLGGDAMRVYAAVAAVLGGVTGALIGLFLWFALGRAPARTRVALAAVVVPLPLGGWGAFVAGSSAMLAIPSMTGLAVVCGSVAAVTQMVWLAPAYTFAARRGWTRLPLVVLAAFTAPVCGLLATMAGFALATA